MINRQAMEELIEETKDLILKGNTWVIDGETEAEDTEEHVPSLREIMRNLAIPQKLNKEMQALDVDVSIDVSPKDRDTILKWLKKDSSEKGLSSFIKGDPTIEGNTITLKVNLAKFMEYLKTAPEPGAGVAMTVSNVIDSILKSIEPEVLVSFLQQAGIYDLYKEKNSVALPRATTYIPRMLTAVKSYSEAAQQFAQISDKLDLRLAPIRAIDKDSLSPNQRTELLAREQAAIDDAERETLALAHETFGDFLEDAFAYPAFPTPSSGAMGLLRSFSIRAKSNKADQSGGFALQYTADRMEALRAMMGIFMLNPKFALGLLQDTGLTAGSVREGCQRQRAALANIDRGSLNAHEQHEFDAMQELLNKLDNLSSALGRLETTASGFDIKDTALKDFAAKLNAQTERVIQESVKLAPGPVQPAVRKGGRLGGRALRSSVVERANVVRKEQQRRDSFQKKVDDSRESANNVDVIAQDIEAKFTAANGGQAYGPDMLRYGDIKSLLTLHFGALLTVERGAQRLQDLVMSTNMLGPGTTRREKFEFLIGLCNQIIQHNEAKSREILSLVDPGAPDRGHRA